jgi:hypothetical protein
MIPKDTRLDSKDDSEDPLENQPIEWADEDREIEDRKPDLGEIEEDTSELRRLGMQRRGGITWAAGKGRYEHGHFQSRISGLSIPYSWA